MACRRDASVKTALVTLLVICLTFSLAAYVVHVAKESVFKEVLTVSMI
jgi:hypothetical protein